MKQKLLTALATKFVGVDANILKRVADKLMSDETHPIKTDDDVTTAVEGVTIQDVITSYGDSRATDATKTAILNYEKKHGLKDGKVVERKESTVTTTDPEPKPEPNPAETSPEGKKILEMLTALTTKVEASEKRLQEMELGKKTDARRAKVNGLIKDLKESQKKAYTRLPLDGYSDDDFDALVDDIEKEVAELVKDNNANNASSFQPPFGSAHNQPTDTKASDAEIQAIVNALS